MILYSNTFENTKTRNYNFPIEDQFYVNNSEAIVADGITRDPIGISDLESCTFEEMVAKYPRPSGAELAAKAIVTSFSNSNGNLKDRLLECNKAVKELNSKYIKDCDYLENDYYGAVSSCVKIENATLHYAFICDCGVIVYKKDGSIKFQTEDEKEKYSDPYINKIGIPWNLPESRVIVRRDYRNNLNNIKDGRCVSYGALTGEETALEFIRYGQLELSSGDIVAIYSDGFINFLHDASFIKQLLNFKADEFEKYVNQQAQIDYNKYGKEKTIVLLKFL